MYPRLFELPWSIPFFGPITVYTYGVLLAAAGCMRDRTPKVLEIDYVRGGGAPLRDQLGTSSTQVGTVQGGERVEVLAKRTRWFQVRLASGRTGWVHTRFLASPKVYD